MAKIYGTALRNIEIRPGLEDYSVTADIYINDDKIGVFFDEGAGGSAAIKFECEESLKSNFYHIMWRYFASYPEVDQVALHDYSLKEFVDRKGALPKIDYRDWPDEKVALFFISQLLFMEQLEEQFTQAKSEGYSSIIFVKYVSLKNIRAKEEQIFYTDGSEEDFNSVIEKIEACNKNYLIYQFRSDADFVIGN